MKKHIRWGIIALSVFMIISLSRSVVDLWERQKIVKQEEERLQMVEKKHEELKKTFEAIQTDIFVEKEARERLGMAKPGETVIIMDNSALGTGATDKTGGMNVVGSVPNWKRWWNVFF